MFLTPPPTHTHSWDSLYTTELTNHAHDPADRGTVWFDDADAEAKMVEFLLEDEDCPPSASASSSSSRQDNNNNNNTTTNTRRRSFLDLGCGNGSLLFALARALGDGDGDGGASDETTTMLGIDYSEQSIALARQIAQEGDDDDDDEETETDTMDTRRQKRREQRKKIRFAVWDLLRGDYDDGVVLAGAQAGGWDVVLDKGTFDAISLSEDKDERGRRICEGYKARVLRLVRTGGLFLVTSCNWTEAELEGWFGEGSAEVEGASFVSVGRVQYPSFSFGGVKGQTISTLCFQKR